MDVRNMGEIGESLKGFTSRLREVPSDPLLGLMALYNADTSAKKADLGVGVYKDERGSVPIPTAVKRAELLLIEQEASKGYTSPSGNAVFIERLRDLVFGQEFDRSSRHFITGIQTPGASGALRIAADFIARCRPGSTIWFPAPTWVNHEPLMGQSGLQLREYPYYDHARQILDIEKMMSALSEVSANDVVLLHACCHNPSGADLTEPQWQTVVEIAERRGFTVLVDMAYQGFGDGLESDAYGLRLLAERLPTLLVTVSCSKNFGLYRDRVGAFYIKSPRSRDVPVCQSHMQDIVRHHYFVPPAHGGNVVATILGDHDLRDEWKAELREARERLVDIRRRLVARVQQSTLCHSLDYLQCQQGMFSFLPLDTNQIESLRTGYNIYMADSGRINLSGLNEDNLSYTISALEAVWSSSWDAKTVSSNR